MAPVASLARPRRKKDKKEMEGGDRVCCLIRCLLLPWCVVTVVVPRVSSKSRADEEAWQTMTTHTEPLERVDEPDRALCGLWT